MIKATITGPRHGLDLETGKMAHLHIELELDYVPAVGETIVINDGSTYIVKSRMWWADTRNDDGYSFHDDLNDDGHLKVMHIRVEPSDKGPARVPDVEKLTRGVLYIMDEAAPDTGDEEVLRRLREFLEAALPDLEPLLDGQRKLLELEAAKLDRQRASERYAAAQKGAYGYSGW